MPLFLLSASIAAYAAFFGWISLERYWDFQMHALDMANMGQAAWNTIHGHPFRFTEMYPPYHLEAWGTTTRLSFHVEALFPIIALVYVIYPHPESLLVLQTVAIALGAVPTFFLARRVLVTDWLALLFAITYLLYPSVEGMNLYEFHPVALATPLLLAAIYWLYSEHIWLFILASLAAIGTKEEIGLVVALIALVGALTLAHRRVLVALAMFGTAWSLFAAGVIEHHYRQPGTLTYLHTRYAWLLGPNNHAAHNALHLLAHDPTSIIRILLAWPKLAYAVRLLAPMGYMALLSPLVLITALPTLALNLFSDDFHMFSGLGQDSAEVLAVIVAASIFGTRRLLALLTPRMGRSGGVWTVGVALLAQALLSQRSDGFTPIGSRFAVASVGSHARVQESMLSLIPSGDAVSTQDQLAPALSSRAGLYLFPNLGGGGLPPARDVLLDVSSTVYPIPSYQMHDEALALLHRGWHIRAAEDGVILLQPGAGRISPPHAFYGYASSLPSRSTSSPIAFDGVQLVGWSRVLLDQPNHPVPSVGFRLTMRRASQPGTSAVMPVVFELAGRRLIGCSADPLGLSWFPSTAWPGHALESFNMYPIETDENALGTPGDVVFEAELTGPLPPDPTKRACGALWTRHGILQPVGTLAARF